MVRRSSWEDTLGVFSRNERSAPTKVTEETINVLLGDKLIHAEPEFAEFLRADRTRLGLYDWLTKGNAPDAEIDRRRMQVMRLGTKFLCQATTNVFKDFSDQTHASELRLWLVGADWHRQGAAIWGICSLSDKIGIEMVLFGLERVNYFQVYNRSIAYLALCLTDHLRCAKAFCQALEQPERFLFVPTGELVAWLANHGRTEAVGATCKVLDRLTGANGWEQEQIAFLAESLAILGTPEAVPSLWIAYRNLKNIAAPSEYQQTVRAALITLSGEQAFKDWESQENG